MKICDNTKELIAIGASITANCQPCLEYHVAKARELGVDPEKIRDAIEVGKLVRQGASGKMDKFALHAIGDPAAACAPDGKCCG
jgi:AhpD family alkylhydroperoxidase